MQQMKNFLVRTKKRENVVQEFGKQLSLFLRDEKGQKRFVQNERKTDKPCSATRQEQAACFLQKKDVFEKTTNFE